MADRDGDGSAARGRCELFAQIAGRGARAGVTLVVTNDLGRISVHPDAFAWLRDAYGAHAWEWRDCDAWRAAAVSGVERALAMSGDTRAVVIERIDGDPADTDDETVAFVASHATWRGLGIAPPVLLTLRGVAYTPR